MKYLKICSFAVALLLLASPAQAAVECTLSTSLLEIRMESNNEKVKDITVTCMWSGSNADLAAVRAAAPTAGATATTADTAATGAKFNLELDINGMMSEDAKAPTLMLMDLDAAAAQTNEDLADTDATKITGVINDDGYRTPMPAGEVSRSSVLWTDIVFPAAWDVGAADSGTAGTGETFMISGIYVDASSVDGSRVEATLVVTSTAINSEDDADIARVKQALDLEFSEDNKAQKFNACEPGDKTISVNLIEGFTSAWNTGSAANEIMLMTSSGKISAKDTGILNVASQDDDNEIFIDVSKAKNNKDDSTDLEIKFEPAMGGEGDITLSAMFFPHRSEEDDMFIKSAELVVGMFDVCKGDPLFFPFVTSMSGWDTGIVVVNDSEVDGSCSLNWGNLKLDEDEMAALSTIDVDAKDHMAFLVSAQRGADYSGSVGVQCSFSSATGYVFLSDAANGIGQGYLVKP